MDDPPEKDEIVMIAEDAREVVQRIGFRAEELRLIPKVLHPLPEFVEVFRRARDRGFAKRATRAANRFRELAVDGIEQLNARPQTAQRRRDCGNVRRCALPIHERAANVPETALAEMLAQFVERLDDRIVITARRELPPGVSQFGAQRLRAGAQPRERAHLLEPLAALMNLLRRNLGARQTSDRIVERRECIHGRWIIVRCADSC